MRYDQDDYGNNSSFRLWWMPFVAIVILAFGIILGLLIREFLNGGQNLGELLKAFGITSTTGVGAFLASAWRKMIEKRQNEQPKPTPPQEKQEPLIVIDRFYENDHVTLANAGVWDGVRYLFNFVTLELPWRDNQKNVSRIFAGEYKAIATKRTSNGKYGILLMNVKDRTEVMIHIGNYYFDTEGCILPGVSFGDINSDGVNDVVDSRKALLKLQEFFPVGTTLKVIINDKF